MYANRKLRSSKLFERSGPSYTPIPYDGGDSTSIPTVSPIPDVSSTTATVPRPSSANRHVNRRLHRYANRKLRSSKLFELSGPSYTPIPYDGGDSTSIPPVSPIQDASSTTATVPRRSIANRHVNRRLHMYAKRKLRSSKLFERSGPSYTPIPYDGGDSPSIPPVSPIQDASSTTATVPRPSIANRHVNRRLHRYAKRKLRSSKLFELSGPSYTPIPYDGGDSTSIPPVSPIQDASSTTATVPRRSIANRHVNRRLHRYTNRKLRSSKLFERLGPSYTPYHMMAESRPLYPLLRLIWAPPRLQRRYHADPLPTGTSIVVYIRMPIAHYAADSCLNDRGLSTHHTIRWRRVALSTSCFASSGHLLDYSDGTTPIHCQQARQSSSTYPSFVRRLGLFRKSDAKKCKMFDRSFCFSTSIVLVF